MNALDFFRNENEYNFEEGDEVLYAPTDSVGVILFINGDVFLIDFAEEGVYGMHRDEVTPLWDDRSWDDFC